MTVSMLSRSPRSRSNGGVLSTSIYTISTSVSQTYLNTPFFTLMILTPLAAVALEYVDPEKSYPSGWQTLDGKIRQSKTSIQATWEQMEKLVDQGLAKNIGISNFQGALVMDLLRYARIRPSVLQIEHHPYLTQETLVKLAKEEGIAITAYSSFGPQSFVELDFKRANDNPSLFENKAVIAIAKRLGKTPAQVLLRWSTQRGLAVIPKSNAQERLLQNLDVTSWDMKKEDLDSISALDRNVRFNNPSDVSVLSIPPPCGLLPKVILMLILYPAVPRNPSHLWVNFVFYSR